MDPITIVVAALVAGITSGLTDIAQDAIQDAYHAFQARLHKKVEMSSDAKDALAKVENEPASPARQELLKEELAKLDIEEDTELLNLAKAILEKLDSQSAKSGKYNITVKDAQGIVIGDQANVTMTFSDSPPRKK
jgi:hypothetical protein